MNFEDKVLALFDNGRRSAVYVAGYQSARAQAAAIAAEADRLIAEMAVENAELRERLSSLESLYRVRDKDCAAKDAELVPVESTADMADLIKRLRIKAGMIELGEIIAWGSDPALMREAPAVQGEPVAYYSPADQYWIDNGGKVSMCGQKTETFTLPLYTAPQLAEQQSTPDVAGLVRVLEMACEHLPIGSQALELAREALATYRKQGVSNGTA